MAAAFREKEHLKKRTKWGNENGMDRKNELEKVD
jgi:hypothetical protein